MPVGSWGVMNSHWLSTVVTPSLVGQAAASETEMVSLPEGALGRQVLGRPVGGCWLKYCTAAVASAEVSQDESFDDPNEATLTLYHEVVASSVFELSAPAPSGQDDAPQPGQEGSQQTGSGQQPNSPQDGTGGGGATIPVAPSRVAAHLVVGSVVRTGTRVQITGTLVRQAGGRVTIVWSQKVGRRTIRRDAAAKVVRGRFTVTLKLPPSLARATSKAAVTATYKGDADTRSATAHATVKPPRPSRGTKKTT